MRRGPRRTESAGGGPHGFGRDSRSEVRIRQHRESGVGAGRVGAGVALSLLIPLVWEPVGLVQGVLALAVVATLNLVFLVLTRELDGDDLALVRRVFGR